jgi:hypothetical protein
MTNQWLDLVVRTVYLLCKQFGYLQSQQEVDLLCNSLEDGSVGEKLNAILGGTASALRKTHKDLAEEKQE